MKLLLLSPHTDDVELGCGGTIAKFLKTGADIFWIVFSNASESLPPDIDKDTLLKEFNGVLKIYNFPAGNVKICGYRVRHLHTHRQEILEEMVSLRKTFNPDLVLGPSVHDFHQDHQIIANEMIRAFKTNSSIISYELPWNHITFNTQLFVKLNEQDMQKKYDALKCYQSQIMQGKEYFSEEFITGLAKTRGIQCNAQFAEAFEVIRWMI